jgi:hypothetical protein
MKSKRKQNLNVVSTPKFINKFHSIEELENNCKKKGSLFNIPTAVDLIKCFPRVKLTQMVFEDSDGKEQAYTPTKECIYLTYDLPELTHEIAHMVEMNNFSRLTLVDWGFWLGRNKSIKSWFAAAAREARVRSIECKFYSGASKIKLSTINGETKWGEQKSSLLDNSLWAAYLRDGLPFGRFKTFNDIDMWIKEIEEHTRKVWSLEKIRHEWKIRVEHICNWMETKENAQ